MDREAYPDPAVLAAMGEFFAAGYFEQPDATPFERWSRAVRRYFENRDIDPYAGTRLVPSGAPSIGGSHFLAPSYSFTWTYGYAALTERIAGAPDEQRATLEALQAHLDELAAQHHVITTAHGIGGRGYTHSVPCYERVVHEGLDEHARRIAAGLAAAQADGAHATIEFYRGLQDVLAGIRAWHTRLVAAIAAWEPPTTDDSQRRVHLLDALRRVPFQPAQTFYEAFLAYNLTFYMDGCDNPGRMDRILAPFYEADLAQGRITRSQALELLREFTANACANRAWSAAIGGTTADGAPAYNEITRLCMETVQGQFRPNYELAIRRDMPDAYWDAALDAIGSGCGQPALYNEELYLRSLAEAELGVADEDLVLWNGGGCTETMIQGRSNVGSLDAGINLALILEQTLRNELAAAGTFDDLLARFQRDVADAVREITGQVNRFQQVKATLSPHPVRSLLIDDCIDRGVDFNAGGARYNWSVINVAGLSNVADSLAALRTVVFDEHARSGTEMLDTLARDFEGEEPFRQRLANCPRFGNDQPEVDTLAADIATFVFTAFRDQAPWRGGKYLPSCIMFETYAGAGDEVGATPDGRRSGEPLADSIGPVTGRDRHGPTAVLRSVTRLPLHLATGTPVLNMRFNRHLFSTPDGRRRLRDLVETYFRLGGMQIQVSVVDADVLRDAIAHPERHADLIVRIGGYSCRFNTLSAALKQTVLARTEHSA